MDYEEILIREYEKIIDLFSSESRTAREHVSIWIAIQVGLGSTAPFCMFRRQHEVHLAF
jgi:hypothetical protein